MHSGIVIGIRFIDAVQCSMVTHTDAHGEYKLLVIIIIII